MSSKEIVKYHNNLNKTYFVGLNARQRDLFALLCVKFTKTPTETHNFSCDEIENILNYRFESHYKLCKELKDLSLKTSGFEFITEKGTYLKFLWREFYIPKNYKEEKIKVSVNPEFVYMFKDLKEQYTSYYLSDFVNIRSKYSKSIYNIIKQWSKKQTFTNWIEINDFRKKLDVPKKYAMRRIKEKILKTAVNELNKYFGDISFNYKKSGRGGKITHIMIKWQTVDNDYSNKTVIIQKLEYLDQQIEFANKQIKNLKGRDPDTENSYISYRIENLKKKSYLKNLLKKSGK